MRASLLISAVCLCLPAQTPPPKEESKGLPPRATALDYQRQAKSGPIIIAAEFKGHSIPTAQGTLTTEDYVVVEVGVYGAPGAHTTISADDFSLRVNGKKSALPNQPFGLVLESVKDPDWEPPAAPHSKTAIGGGGGGGGGQDNGPGSTPPPPPPVPFPIKRALQVRVQKAALPEGDRPLPQAGFIFFRYTGLSKGIHEVELLYNGPTGKAVLRLWP
ncbi:MAG TPA: hypothetical protein VG456_00245 [Candidatus Sulfopaludibacter sp.]|nr:hypothetical protein [Candidatus Sulfopaludibacter sp.]